ncbi:putative secreted protein (Por secretion system target) [Jejuia pallidilutea]|uniref:Putative secreted protein (Por secretion system target) n=1 Tax=Jejuia pallidilutea TaxID=504487 RepID=A0A362XED2_9FLAO|nr:T9SS type A sorting domain-containing protein [Jejuia pallidilutea]PQV51600.1 putative secreted protein (Por secretion system target) [Jejuia pallidilutea]
MKKLLVFIGLCIAFFYGNAQNNSYYNRMQHIFGNIDKTKVTTGYLKEFGIRFNEVEAYNGAIASDNLVDKTQWQSLYSSLYTMRVGTVAQNMTNPSTVFNNLKTQQTGTKTYFLAAQYYTYQQYKANAYTNGDVTVSNDRIYDVAGRNPYDTKTVFAVTPLKTQLQGHTFTFKLPSTMVYTNTSAALNQIQIDFGNGSGYQTVALNTAKSVTYTSGGVKTLKYKFVYAGGTTLYSHSKIWVDYIAPQGGPMARFDGAGANTEVITGAVWQGVANAANVTIELAEGHTELTKPLIVVEGFDPDGSFNYRSFIDRDDPGGIEVDINPDPAILYTLNEAIEDEDYDLVFIDFVNGTDFIQRNALVVEAVIDTVNARKTAAGSTEQNVVLGMSMGGLIARYALRDMEIKSETHDTKLYISHDAPHQGANVPLAYQAMVRHLVGEQISIPVFFSIFNINVADISDHIPELEEGLALLQTPAAQQMLVYQLEGTGDGVSVDNSTLFHTFSTGLSNMGYPTQGNIRNIAIANGSECGTPLGFDAYGTLVDVNETIDLPKVVSHMVLPLLNITNPLKYLSSVFSFDTDIKAQFNLRALPNQQSQQIYKGKIFIRKEVLGFIIIHEDLIDEETVNSSSSMLPLDNAGGGVYNIDTFVTLPPEVNAFVLEREFNFIPTFSSLDIGSGTQTINAGDLAKAYSPLSPPPALKNTPFHNFFTNDITSEQHIQFTLNNGNWLMDELRDTSAYFSCASTTCTGTLGLRISGPSQVCTSSSSNYSISSLPSNVTVNWSINPSGGFTITPNGHSVTITPNGLFAGEGVLTASIDTDCNDSVEITKTIQTGAQRPIIYDSNGNQVASFNFPLYTWESITFSTPPGTLEWEWEKVSGNFTLMANNTNYAQVYASQNTSGIVTVRIRDNCGWGPVTFLSLSFGSGGGGFGFRTTSGSSSPSLSLEIIEGDTNPNTSKTATSSSIANEKTKGTYAIMIADMYGATIFKVQQIKQKRVDIKKDKWPKGIYFVRVSNNKGEAQTKGLNL